MTLIQVDLSSVCLMKDFHDKVQMALDFPYYYGRNLNAFWDCLTDLPTTTCVEFLGVDSLPLSLQQEVNRYRELLQEFQGTGRKGI